MGGCIAQSGIAGMTRGTTRTMLRKDRCAAAFSALEDRLGWRPLSLFPTLRPMSAFGPKQHMSAFGGKADIPPSSKALLDNGAKYLARGGRTASIKGEPPKRIVLLTFENFEKAQAAFNSSAFQAAVQIGEKYAKFRIYAVEGAPVQ
jgi:uncharacterized protein (DUF1330 family)